MNNNVSAGVGYADLQNSLAAGRQAAAAALSHSGQDAASLALAFCGGKHDYEACFEGMRSVLGETQILGGAAIGIITNEHSGYQGYEVGVAVLPPQLSPRVARADGLDAGEQQAGMALGRQLRGLRAPDDQLILLFYDSVRRPPPPAPELNVSSYLLNGVMQTIGDDPPPIVGAGLVGTFNFDAEKLYCGDRVADQHVAAAVLSGPCSASSTIMHGCKPMSDYRTITRVEGPVVYEIDGQPATEVIDDLLGTRDWQDRMPLLTVTMGVNHGDRYGPFDESKYVNRLIVGVVPQDRALVLFEADFEDGAQFQFMQRNNELMVKSSRAGCLEALARMERDGQRALLALYIDCAGRTSAFSGAEIEEASVVQQTLGREVPLLGFYSGVEIAPLLGKSRGLDWTGVLVLLTTDR